MELAASKPITFSFSSTLNYFTRPLRIFRDYKPEYLRFDILSGLTVAVVLLPQAIAFAMVAELPPATGIYTAVVGAIVGALWGSSNHMQTGPSTASSLLLLSVLAPVVAVGTPEYIAAAALTAVLVGVFRVAMGVLKLGMLVNFISDSVIVGFTAGAGVLIVFNQLRHFFGLKVASSPMLLVTVQDLAFNIMDFHRPTLLLALGTLVLLLLLRRFSPSLPSSLIALITSAAAVAFLNLDHLGVAVIGELPRGFPPLVIPPLFNYDLISNVTVGALAIAAIGLVQATAISRSIASQTGQRLDYNQEFVGQGLASLACGFFSGYVTTGSFLRSAINHEAGAKTALAAALSGVFLLVTMFLFAPYAVYVPRAALAAVVIVAAYNMVNRAEMRRIWRSTRGDTAIMITTLLATLFLPLQFAVLSGILMSLAYYLLKTSTPNVLNVLPDASFKHLIPQPERAQCPQLAVIEIRGDLYFGAVNHVEERILDNKRLHPEQRYLLLRMQNVQHLDISGVHMLESLMRTYRDQGGDIYLTKVRPAVLERMKMTGFDTALGEDHFLEEDEAISYLFYKVLDPAVCIYECDTRAFYECQNLPRPALALTLPPEVNGTYAAFDYITPQELYRELRQSNPPLLIDVREAREFKKGHIPEARLVPLSKILTDPPDLPQDAPIVLVCRTSRRSRRAAQALRHMGITDIRILDGGMLAWEDAHLLEAIEDSA